MCKSKADGIGFIHFFKQISSRSCPMTPKFMFYDKVEVNLLQTVELEDAAGEIRMCVCVHACVLPASYG
jgi:hypothetical protein